jgi:hypothetical protein
MELKLKGKAGLGGKMKVAQEVLGGKFVLQNFGCKR